MKNIFLTLLTFFSICTIVKSENHTINAGAYYYSPEILTINVGDVVTWINDGGFHDVNADMNTQTGESFNNPESFQSNTTNETGATIYTHTFTTPGTYNYDCSVGSHAAQGMIGQIVVDGGPSELNSIMYIVANSGEHETLQAALEAAGLNGTLDSGGPFTLFAPSDDAFAALPEGTVDDLLDDLPQLTEVLLHHVVNGTAMAGDLNDGDVLTTLNNDNLTVSIDGMTYMIDMATVTAANIEASNGVVHVIDMVLIPTEEPELPSIMDIVTESEAHTILEAAINAAGLNELLDGEDPFTLFAPTDDAFDALPEGTVATLLANIDELIEVLAHHVVGGTFMAEDLNDGDVLTTANDDNLTVTVDGMTYMIDMATVISANIEASNGVVHVIDMVLIPETNDQTVMSIIENSPIHTTLETAIIAAGLANTLSGDGSFTVFAPSDEVFAALPDGALDLILANTELLTNLLLGHVHEGELYSADLTDGLNVTMMNEGDLTVSNDGMTIMIDDAIIFQEDLPATNGVVHVIDNILPSTVIDPDTLTVMSIIEASPEHTTLEAAINAAELAETLSGEGPFTVFAPTDDAFALLPAGTVEGLLADIPALTEILLHHVVGATALSTDFNDGDVLTTLNTTELTVSVDDGTYIIDMATVTAANLEADNGVVHVIGMVLIPADPSSINEFNTTDIYMYSLNLLGEKVDRNTKGEVIIDIYTNGKTVKRLNLNK